MSDSSMTIYMSVYLSPTATSNQTFTIEFEDTPYSNFNNAGGLPTTLVTYGQGFYGFSADFNTPTKFKISSNIGVPTVKLKILGKF